MLISCHIRKTVAATTARSDACTVHTPLSPAIPHSHTAARTAQRRRARVGRGGGQRYRLPGRTGWKMECARKRISQPALLAVCLVALALVCPVLAAAPPAAAAAADFLICHRGPCSGGPFVSTLITLISILKRAPPPQGVRAPPPDHQASRSPLGRARPSPQHCRMRRLCTAGGC